MRIGYPCINHSFNLTSGHTFRLANFSDQKLIETVNINLNALEQTLKWNALHGIFYFRICSGIIPFASHPINTFDWQKHFRVRFTEIGNFAKQKNIRLTMHPDQFVLINSIHENIFENSVRELIYHAQILDLLGCNLSAKVQIHVGGVYGNKEQSIDRFIARYKSLPDIIRNRLVIENDDRLYSVKDCLQIHEKTNIPVVFDNLHFNLNNNGETESEAIELAASTWKKIDGLPMIDYSEQKNGARSGSHTDHIDTEEFKGFLKNLKNNSDIMLEIKDKEASALSVINTQNSNELLD